MKRTPDTRVLGHAPQDGPVHASQYLNSQLWHQGKAGKLSMGHSVADVWTCVWDPEDRHLCTSVPQNLFSDHQRAFSTLPSPRSASPCSAASLNPTASLTLLYSVTYISSCKVQCMTWKLILVTEMESKDPVATTSHTVEGNWDCLMNPSHQNWENLRIYCYSGNADIVTRRKCVHLCF